MLRAQGPDLDLSCRRQQRVLVQAVLIERPLHHGEAVRVRSGRYGPYVNAGKVNANVPKGSDPAALTMEQAVALLAERAAKGGGKPKRGFAKKAAPKAAGAKAPAKKAAAKKPAAKKKKSPAKKPAAK